MVGVGWVVLVGRVCGGVGDGVWWVVGWVVC